MLSTPLTCCSIGVATDCSRVLASAPTYVARIWISGGTILGNWATGSVAMVTAPTITVNIAMTIATIGRRMKNLDISIGSSYHRFREDLGVDLHTRTSVLNAFGNDALTRL